MAERVWLLASNDPETGAPVHAPRWMDQYLQGPFPPEPPKPPLDP